MNRPPIYRMKTNWAQSIFVREYLTKKYGENWNKVRRKELYRRLEEGAKKYDEKKGERKERYLK